MWSPFKKKVQGEKARFTINGLHCTSCVLNIDGALEDLDGVFSSTTNYSRSIAEIEYDPQKVSLDTLKRTIEEQGYTVL